MLTTGLVLTARIDVDLFRSEGERAGCSVFVLPVGINSRDSFVTAVRGTLPLDPPLQGSRSWDALSDSLWEGLRVLAASRIAILWPGARSMASADPSAFEIAISILADLTVSLADVEATRGASKQLAVVVEDAGSSQGEGDE